LSYFYLYDTISACFPKIKNKLEKELPRFLADINKQYGLTKISPLLFRRIREFALRDGKRIRPALFVIGYLGFAKKPSPASLYQRAGAGATARFYAGA